METGQEPQSIGIELKITNRCNLHCGHCMNEDSPCSSGDVDIPLFVKRLEEKETNSAGSRFRIKEVRITGGEPLLALDGVTQIARACKELGVDCGINTNGTLLTPRWPTD